MITNPSINAIGQHIGLKNMKEEVCVSLTQEVEFRIRSIIQNSKKFMKHSKRKKLTCEDILHSLSLKNVEPLYGYKSQIKKKEENMFVKVDKVNDIYYIPDEEVDIKDYLSAPLSKLPVGPSISSHWLCINGVQPRIPQNPIPETLVVKKKQGDDLMNIEPIANEEKKIKHVLSSQLVLFYKKVTNEIKSGDLHKKRKILKTLSSNTSLHQLIPYFVRFISEEINQNLLYDLDLLKSLVEMAHSLLVNPNIQIELYVNQLIPSLLTLCVTKKLGNKPNLNHWELRDFSAYLVSIIYHRFRKSYKHLEEKIQGNLIGSLLDISKPLQTHYGAIKGITELGQEAIQYLLFNDPEPTNATDSNLIIYLKYLTKYLNNSKTKSDAMRCLNSLQLASGIYLNKFGNFFQTEIKEGNEIDEMETENDETDEILQIKKELLKRSLIFDIPNEITDQYSKMYKMFGESIFPFINYQINESVCNDNISLMDVFL